jgi:ATP-dependent DNA helicase RecG
MQTTDPNALERPVQFLKGAGPRRAELLGKLGIAVVGDLLEHYPHRYVDRSRIGLLADAREGAHVTCLVEVVDVSIRPTRHRRMKNFTALLRDESGAIEAIWFNQAYLQSAVKPGARLMVSGEVGRYGGRLQLRNPEYESITDDDQAMLHTGRIVPVYPLTGGVSQRLMRSLVRQAVDAAEGRVEETLPDALCRRLDLATRAEAVREIHFPLSWDAKERARRRLVYEELLIAQILISTRRRHVRSRPAIAFEAKGELARRVARRLPFELTGDQKRALVTIRDDLRAPHPMHRMVMGDVGSGKTVVAVLAGCLVIEDGYQVALLAPTELLAEQHARSMRLFLGGELVEVHLLTGSTRAKERRQILAAAAEGRPGFFLGTHAIIQDAVEFGRLGLVVIDEQHRFGVRQRAALGGKAGGADARDPDVLVMTATPIPRSLYMTRHGDLDLTRIEELPAGRGAVITRIVREPKREAVYDFVRGELEAGRRAYVVCPVIEESEATDLKAAEAMAARLASHAAFRAHRVGLVHGRMSSAEKAETMSAFRSGEIHVLVTTTVVEVGVDVPEATVMLVEHPERYGLSQLHQLRGRVGRGGDRSVFVLMAGRDVSREAYERLQVLVATRSGFEVAEKDLELRGPGDVIGTRQHGAPALQLLHPGEHDALVRTARDDANALLDRDPELMGGPAERALRGRVISRFGEEASALLRAG